MAGGVAILAAGVLAVAIAISSGGSSPPKLTGPSAAHTAATVDALLAGIPQSGNTLGSQSARVVVTEFGDLECPVCSDLALGPENQLIANDVRAGKVKLVYRSVCSATCGGPQPSVFATQQVAAYAAGLQGRAWNYIELFYHLQGDESTRYANARYLDGLARLVTRLDYSKWLSDRNLPALRALVTADESAARVNRVGSTPTIVVQGPKGTAQPIVGADDYSAYEAAIKSVS